MPMRFSRPSTTPHGEKPMQTISDLAFGDLAKRASPTCLTTPNDNGKTFFFFSFVKHYFSGYLVDIRSL